jgi:hypothetical protein
MAGFDNDTVYGTNIDFSGQATPAPTMLQDGQLLIGSTALNGGGTHCNIGTLSSSDNSITITNGPGSINIRSNPNVVPDLHTAKWIVNPIPNSGGNQVTIQNAINAASAGDTIVVMPGNTGIYTENLTLKAGVNIAAWAGDGLTPNVTILGKATASFAGTATISGINLKTNSDFFLVVSGSSATNINLLNCNLTCSNNTGISYTTSSSSSAINIYQCIGNLATTGIAYFSSSSPGSIVFFNSNFGNTGASTTANSSSNGAIGLNNSQFTNPFSVTSSGNIQSLNGSINCKALNTTAVTTAGTGSTLLFNNIIYGGSATAITVGAGTTVSMTGACSVQTSNGTAAISGAGTLTYSPIAFTDIGNIVSVTTRNPQSTGTWTPTIVGASTAGATTYTNQVGYYTIIGNLCWINCLVTCSAATGTGDVNIGGLPFASKNLANLNSYGAGMVFGSASIPYPAGRTWASYSIQPNSSVVFIPCGGTAVATSNLQMANTALNFQFTMVYEI